MQQAQQTFQFMPPHGRQPGHRTGLDKRHISLKCDNNMAGVIIDRFGKDVTRFPKEDGTFTVHVNVIPSGQFFGWIFGLNGRVTIIAPEEVVSQMRGRIKMLSEQYNT